MRNLLFAILLAGFSTGVMAQGPQDVTALLGNVPGALTTLVGNDQAAAVSLLDGDVTNFFRNGNNGNIGFVNELTAGTAGEPLAAVIEQLSHTGFNTLLPLYKALDGPAMQLAAAAAPLFDPVKAIIESNPIDSGSLASLPLSTDALDPATVTQLLNGASLPGL